jgi:hypothetical protein
VFRQHPDRAELHTVVVDTGESLLEDDEFEE